VAAGLAARRPSSARTTGATSVPSSSIARITSRRRGDREVRTMVLAEAEHVQADLVGELDLLDQVAQALLGADRPARVWVGGQLGEGVDAKFHEGRAGVGKPALDTRPYKGDATRHRPAAPAGPTWPARSVRHGGRPA
jgi:hypothetical protein